jgi:hypothetical protein
LITLVLYPTPQRYSGGIGLIGMEYRQFVIQAFETETGRWRARIWRANGKSLRATGRRKPREFVTGLDSPTAVAAIVMAMTVIEAGTFSRTKEAYTEKFWRLRRRRSAALGEGASQTSGRNRGAPNRRAAYKERPGNEYPE